MLELLKTGTAAPQKIVKNQVLATLDTDAFGLIKPHLKRVDLRKGMVLLDANRPVEAVYFIETGLVSRFATTPTDSPVEVAVVGWFGFIGISVVLGSSRSLHRTVVQVPGQALRIAADDLRLIMRLNPEIRDHLLRYVQLVIGLKAQIALCNARHSVDQRLARWMLLAADRMENNELPVTHEILARTLGVRRPSVSTALTALEADAIIAKSRATMRILSRDMLGEKSCACYRTIADKYAAMRALKHFEHRIDF
jgi:CRP-like cAMP-binding protein